MMWADEACFSASGQHGFDIKSTGALEAIPLTLSTLTTPLGALIHYWCGGAFCILALVTLLWYTGIR